MDYSDFISRNESTFSFLLNVSMSFLLGTIFGFSMGIFVSKRLSFYSVISVAILIAVISISFFTIQHLNVFDSGGDWSIQIPDWMVMIASFKPGIKELLLLFLVLFFVVLFFYIRSPAKKEKDRWSDDVTWEDERDTETERRKETVTEEVHSALDTAIDRIDRGEEVREVILNAYTKMSQILVEEGVSYDESITPREFQQRALERLDLPPDKLEDLTSIFEEARFSSHELDEVKKERALEDLRAVQETFSGLADF